MSDERQAAQATDAYIDAVRREGAPGDDPVVRILIAAPPLPPRLAGLLPEPVPPDGRRPLRRLALPALAAALLLVAVLAAFPPARAAAAETVRAVLGAAGYMRGVVTGGDGERPRPPDGVLGAAVEAVSRTDRIFYTEMVGVPVQESGEAQQDTVKLWFDAEGRRARQERYQDGRLQSITVIQGRTAARLITQGGTVDRQDVDVPPGYQHPAVWSLPYLEPLARYDEALIAETRTLDGRTVVHLRASYTDDQPGGDFPPGVTYITDVYLDPEGYLPLRMEVAIRPPAGMPLDAAANRPRPAAAEHDDEILLFRFDFHNTEFLDRAAIPAGHFSEGTLRRQSPEAWRQLEDFDRYPLFWLGPSFGGYPLEAVIPVRYDAPPGVPPMYSQDSVSFIYGRCDDPPCSAPISMHVQPACKVRPEQTTVAVPGPPETVRGGALVKRGKDQILLWTGGSFVTVHLSYIRRPDPPDPAAVEAAIQALQGYGRNSIGPGEPLPPPDFSGCG